MSTRPEVPDISEALWETSKEYGVRLAVDEQVAIARIIREQARWIPTSASINRAFVAIGLHAPRGYSVAVRNRLSRLFPAVPGLPSSFPVGSVSGSPKLPHAYNVREEE